MQTPTKQQGGPPEPRKANPGTEETGERGGPREPPRQGKTKQERGTKGASRISPSRANFFPAWGQSGPVLFPGGGYQRLRQLSPGVRCASVPDGHGPGRCAGRRRCPASSRGPLRDVIDALERSRLRIPQNQLPDGIGDVACLGGLAKSKPGHLLVHNGDPATGPRAPPCGSTPTAPSPSGCRGHPGVCPTPVARWPCRPGSGGGRRASTPCSTCTWPPRVSPFVFGMSSHRVTELRTRPHSMCAQKTCFVSAG